MSAKTLASKFYNAYMYITDIDFSKGVPGEQRLADQAPHAVSSRAAPRGHDEE